jgi:hypothetical protein
VAYGLAQDKPVTLLVGSVIPLGMIAVLLRVYAHLMPIAAVAIRLERELMPGRDGLATTYYMLTSKALFDALDTPTSRTAALRRRLLSSGTCRLLGIVSLTQVLIFVFYCDVRAWLNPSNPHRTK